MIYSVLITTFIGIHGLVMSDARKRILLSGSTSDNSDITGLESKIQVLTVKVDNLDTLKTTVDHLTHQVTVLQRQNHNLSTQMAHLSKTRSGSGAIYTRWGRTTCPHNDTELVYAGWTGGSFYQEAGGSPERYCLPKNPQWDPRAGNVSLVYMHGGYYDQTFFGATSEKSDTPCAVCHVTSRASMLMIPARMNCNHGWRKEYSGFLAGNYFLSKASADFVCLDGHPEGTPNAGGGFVGTLFNPVSGVCGHHLRCPPYVDHKALSCVVCTK